MADVPPVVIRPSTEADLADADRVLRVAFGTFVGVPEPRGAGPGHGYGARPGRILGRRWQLFSRRVGQLLLERLLVR